MRSSSGGVSGETLHVDNVRGATDINWGCREDDTGACGLLESSVAVTEQNVDVFGRCIARTVEFKEQVGITILVEIGKV